jgi:putative FmdB family regulatory protein
MPTYEYACRKCDEVIEVFQSMRDDPLANCPKCGEAGVKRLIGRGAGIIFKGSGFYETDYKRPAQKPAESSGGAESSKPSDSSKPAASSSPPPAKSD